MSKTNIIKNKFDYIWTYKSENNIVFTDSLKKKVLL